MTFRGVQSNETCLIAVFWKQRFEEDRNPILYMVCVAISDAPYKDEMMDETILKINGYCLNSQIDRVMDVFDSMETTILKINGYCLNGQMDRAMDVFDSMETTILKINGYCLNGQMDRAMDVFDSMETKIHDVTLYVTTVYSATHPEIKEYKEKRL
ncbi:hypothetical protein RJ639_030034 [Escallonia herrerae]|uniref:Uncharacterized protein n=1 Tax=Escallonia herrerae TaxID=1293975 RepID=A0AA89BC59_9ASTE|nr:hypothetical protein RJ639_030034 [Escallonia herrerae]